jgi:hypothetical protein
MELPTDGQLLPAVAGLPVDVGPRPRGIAPILMITLDGTTVAFSISNAVGESKS